ncbi:MAG: PDR/VanB family oxidoreductase [Pantoea sp.]|uniref:PDR/VanB family oxidoreductase n=1 Tax=Pantoea sp. TaxID=69393 RepID=UPI00239442FC|nr:PDR/VanB family oxidoreductase [Pantoea sp.]MDE1189033.1 PDR/VanB family oxidoreductase [Pantoea sp.]
MAVRLLIKVRVSDVSVVAKDILSLEFSPVDREKLPVYLPGSNVILRLKKGLSRQYSLCGNPDSNIYKIAVKRETQGRGGSEYVHNQVRKDDILYLSYPQPDFNIDINFDSYVFIAGGIGITPLLSFLYFLSDKNKKVSLHYCVRDIESAAFLDELRHFPIDLKVYCSAQGRRANFEDILSNYKQNTALYYCGSARLSEAVCRATHHWPAGAIFSEYFSPPVMAGEDLGDTFTAEIPRSGHILTVPENKTLLQVLLDDGVDLDFSCEAGTCRSCIIDIVSGEIIHKDKCLTEDERKTLMTPCVSRGKGVIVINSL